MRTFKFPKGNPRLVIGGPVHAPDIAAGVERVERWNPGAPHYIFAWGKVLIVLSPTVKHSGGDSHS